MRMLGIPDRVSARVAVESDIKAIRYLLTKEIRRALHALADKIDVGPGDDSGETELPVSC
jgi:hypothetical protein